MNIESSVFFVNCVGAGTISILPSAYGRSACCCGRERRRQRIDPLGENHRAGVQLVVPEIRDRQRLLDDARSSRRRVLLASRIGSLATTKTS